MKKEKQFVTVFKRGTSSKPKIMLKVIKRVLISEQFGNFSPVFCRYNKRYYQVQSTIGDLSDPFRVTKDYLNHLYIEVEQ